MTVHIHPSVDSGVKRGSGSFAGGTLVCKCKDKPVKVSIKGDVAHNHACGCTKCWKPAGATFSVVAVVPRDNVTVLRTATSFTLSMPRPQSSGTPARSARTCTAASRTRRIRSMGWTSSIPNCSRKQAQLHRDSQLSYPGDRVSGVNPSEMDGIRSRLKELGLEPYDCLSPALMDAIATHVAKSKPKAA